jgi:PAS domain S-box-containing protein
MSKSRPTYQELEKRLATAEPIVEALKHHEVDAVIGEGKITFLLLRKVEEALVSSEAGFRVMFDLSGIGMVQADTPALRFTRVNQKFCEIVGYSRKELLARTYMDLTHPQDRHRDMKALARVLRAKTDSWSIEKRCVRKDGIAVWMRVDGAVLRDEDGRAVRVMAMISDLTACKQAERERREAEEKLKGRVRERTAKLAKTIQSLRSQVAKCRLAEQVLRDKSSAEKGKPMRRKKAAVKKAR